MSLQRDANIDDADGLYAAIIDAHSDLSHDDSVALNARLVLLLANHIGDAAVLREAIAVARASVGKPTAGSPPSSGSIRTQKNFP